MATPKEAEWRKQFEVERARSDRAHLVAALLSQNARSRRAKMSGILPSEGVFESYQRLSGGYPQPGDSFAVRRAIFKIIRSASHDADLVWLAMQLGRSDEAALAPWQMVLRMRPLTQRMREIQKATNLMKRRVATHHANRGLFMRVVDHQEENGSTLSQAFHAVALGYVGSFGLANVKARAVSPAKVKEAYRSQLALAQAAGFIREGGGLQMPKVRVRPLPPTPKKGRPRKS